MWQASQGDIPVAIMAATKMTSPAFQSPATDPDPWQVVSTYAPYMGIAHQISGRVRLKLDTAALDMPELKQFGADRLKAALGTVRGVRAITLNLLARSCVIEYDRSVIPDAAWPDLLARRPTDAARTLIGILQEKYEEIRHG